MPIPKYDGSPENEWIGKCLHQIGGEYEQDQALAICYKQMEEMGGIDLAIEDTSELPEPKEGETQDKYLMRCIPTIYKEGGEYDQRTATAMCADRYQNSNTLLKKENMSKSPFQRQAEEFEARLVEMKAREVMSELNLAEGEKYDWDQCIADQTERYGDEETAAKVCGYIKSKS